MTTINSTSPLTSYLAGISKSAASSSSSAEENTNSDPVAEVRRLAAQMVARSEGGLLRALNSSNQAPSSAFSSGRVDQNSGLNGSTAQIQLPDVSDMDRDDAAKLLVQIDKLVDAGLGDSTSFVGFKDGQQTESLATYRDWLQEKGGISVYV